LVVLVTIVMTMVLIRILGQASAGKVNPTEIGLIVAIRNLLQCTSFSYVLLFFS
jgi:lipopolysaccharide export system permease protein